MGSEQAVVVEPPDPFEGGEFDVLDPRPGTAGVDELGLVEADDGLGQGTVVVAGAGVWSSSPYHSRAGRVASTTQNVLGLPARPQ